MHSGGTPSRAWLPFVVRLYFTAGLSSIRLVHSFVFDGDAQTDYISGLGIAFTVPFREEKQNRHVRFGGEGDGFWVEPVLMSPAYRDGMVKDALAMNLAQLAGKRIPNLDQLGPKEKSQFETVAVWDAFKLNQLAPDSFSHLLRFLVVAGHRLSELTACKLLDLGRSSYRYEPRPNHNAELREELLKLARQKPRGGYRRLVALLNRRGPGVNVQRVNRLYPGEGLSVRRTRHKRLVRDRAAEPRLLRADQEWATDFIVDGLATGRIVRILSVVDAYTRECLALEADTSHGSGRVTRVLGWLIEQRGRPESVRWDNGPEFPSRRILGLGHRSQGRTGAHAARSADAERPRRELPRQARDECLNTAWFRTTRQCPP